MHLDWRCERHFLHSVDAAPWREIELASYALTKAPDGMILATVTNASDKVFSGRSSLGGVAGSLIGVSDQAGP